MGLSFEEYGKLIELTPYPRPQPLQSEKEKDEYCGKLLKFLLRERGMIAAFTSTYPKKRALVRAYMNERAALPIPDEILFLQDRLFYTETLERGIVSAADLPEGKLGISLWQGDITRIDADAVVNAANEKLLGCFLPGHNCIDNVIHSFAGMQVRRDCAKIMAQQGQDEEVGDVKVTRAYNLPSKYIFHTVGPVVGRELEESQIAQLRSSYISCLNLAEEMKLRSIAFCCISTGVFNFPRAEAAEIAAGAAVGWKLHHPDSRLKVIFNTFLDEDTALYRNILKMI